MVKRTTTSNQLKLKGTKPTLTQDPLAAFKKWSETNSPNSYADFIRENPVPNVSERFEGLPREYTMKTTEGGKRRRKTITKSKSKKVKSKKNKSKKVKSKKNKSKKNKQ